MLLVPHPELSALTAAREHIVHPDPPCAADIPNWSPDEGALHAAYMTQILWSDSRRCSCLRISLAAASVLAAASASEAAAALSSCMSRG